MSGPVVLPSRLFPLPLPPQPVPCWRAWPSCPRLALLAQLVTGQLTIVAISNGASLRDRVNGAPRRILSSLRLSFFLTLVNGRAIRRQPAVSVGCRTEHRPPRRCGKMSDPWIRRRPRR